MCDCLNTIEKKTIDLLKSEVEKDHQVAEYRDCGFVNRVIFFNSKRIPLALPFSITYYKKKKDGTPESKLTTRKTNLMISYCPFCGEKQDD